MVSTRSPLRSRARWRQHQRPGISECVRQPATSAAPLHPCHDGVAGVRRSGRGALRLPVPPRLVAEGDPTLEEHLTAAWSVRRPHKRQSTTRAMTSLGHWVRFSSPPLPSSNCRPQSRQRKRSEAWTVRSRRPEAAAEPQSTHSG
jgi:hypothetical protein